MNKKEFLNELEKRLSILVESERKDIINEYKDNIEEKVKHGSTEEDAIASFGSLDELVKEILSAYKINYEYKSTKDNVKNIVDDCGNLIERGAKWLSDTTKGIVDEIKKKDSDFSLEKAFELILKFFLVLILLLLARIPFAIVGGILEGIIGIGLTPFDWFTRGVVYVFIWVIYIAFCATVCVAIFKKYFTPNQEIKSEVKTNKNKKSKKEEPIVNDDSKEDIKEEATKETVTKVSNKQVEVKKNDNALIIILKIFAFLIFILPLFFINLGLIISISVVIYFIVKGIMIWQILLILFGLLWIFGSIEDNLQRLLWNRRLIVFPFFVGVVLVVVGSLATFDLATRMDYYNYLPNNNLNIETKTVQIELNKDLYIDTYGDYDVVVDNDIVGDRAVIEISYYNQIIELEENIINKNNRKTLDIDTNTIRHFKIIKNIIIDNLKNYKLYNYSDFYKTSIKVHVNQENIAKIKQS